MGDARIIRGILCGARRGDWTSDDHRPVDAVLIQRSFKSWSSNGRPGRRCGLCDVSGGRGFVVFAIDYRHAPRWPWPAQIDDVRTAIAWVREHARAWGRRLTAGAVKVVGRALRHGRRLLVGSDRQRGREHYGPVDLDRWLSESAAPDPPGVRAIEAALLGGTPEQIPIVIATLADDVCDTPRSAVAAHLWRPRPCGCRDMEMSTSWLRAADATLFLKPWRACLRRGSQRTARSWRVLHGAVSRGRDTGDILDETLTLLPDCQYLLYLVVRCAGNGGHACWR